jgi:hypothetical protein
VPGDYIDDQRFSAERAPASIESRWDPGSRRQLDGLGRAAGWRRLEVGVGSGSLVNCMADVSRLLTTTSACGILYKTE